MKFILITSVIVFITATVQAQKIVINEVMPSNISSSIDEDGDYSDWIEFYNPGYLTVNLSGYSLACNSGTWFFPEWRMEAGKYALVMASSKDKKVPVKHWETIIRQGDLWKYKYGSPDIPSNWNALNFNDSDWLSGETGIGYGDGDDATEIDKTVSLYIRKTFVIDNLDDIVQAVLHVDYDDGFVAYLNGVEIARANIGNKGIMPSYDALTIVDRDARIYQGGTPAMFQIGRFDSIAVVGENVLAIQVHNSEDFSSDFTVIPFLTLGYNIEPNNNAGTPAVLTNFPSGLHTSFKISENDTIVLISNTGDTVDQVSLPGVADNISAGRQPDGSENFFYFDEPTPADQNFTYGSGIVLFKSSDLPIVVINTNGQIIPDEPKITADMGIIYNGEGKRNNLTDPFNNYEGRIGIELRGASSRLVFPKKQYAIETRDNSGENRNVSLLGLPEENDWILSAPYADKSMMRDVFMYKLSSDIGKYASRSRFCELVLNGEYKGIYILLEKIKQGKNRVDIAKLKAEDISGIELTGGYILKIDKIIGSETGGWRSDFPKSNSPNSRPLFQYHFPAPGDIIPEQAAYIQEYFRYFETALSMNKATYIPQSDKYPKYINVESFVDYAVMTEFSNNVDAYRLSTFLVKDKDTDGGKLSMGPIWDFNIALGNADYGNGEFTDIWRMPKYSKNDSSIPFWWREFSEDEFFTNSMYTRWFRIREQALSDETIKNTIDSLAALLNEAQERNFKKWPVLGKYIWPNPANWETRLTFLDEVNYLKQWILDRARWIDKNIPGRLISSTEDDEYPKVYEYSLSQNYPNPFNPATSINYSLQKAGNVKITIHNLLGEQVVELVNQQMPAGKHNVVWDSRDTKSRLVASGVYFYKMEAGEFSQTKKIILLR